MVVVVVGGVDLFHGGHHLLHLAGPGDARILGAGKNLPTLAQEALRWAIEHAEARPQVSELAVPWP